MSDSAPQPPPDSSGEPAPTADPPTPGGDAGDPRTRRWATVPNILCVIRLLVSPLLILLALADQAQAFVLLFVALSVTDWIDGKIAGWFTGQRSHVGPRLDSAADAVMYASLTLGAILMRWDLIHQEIVWLTVAVASYAAAVVVGLVRLRVWPSYHTRLAKTSWLLIAVAVIAALLEWSPWPLRVALVAVTLTNLETLAISFLLHEPKTNVKSIISVVRQNRSAESVSS